MAEATWTPSFITKTAEYKKHEIMSSDDMNMWLNMFVTQHNNMVTWLLKLSNGDFDAVYPKFSETLQNYTETIIYPMVEEKAKSVVGFYTDNKDADGNDTEYKYIHWENTEET